MHMPGRPKLGLQYLLSAVAVQKVSGPTLDLSCTLHKGEASSSGVLLRSWLHTGAPEPAESSAAAILVDWATGRLEVGPGACPLHHASAARQGWCCSVQRYQGVPSILNPCPADPCMHLLLPICRVQNAHAGRLPSQPGRGYPGL